MKKFLFELSSLRFNKKVSKKWFNICSSDNFISGFFFFVSFITLLIYTRETYHWSLIIREIIFLASNIQWWENQLSFLLSTNTIWISNQYFSFIEFISSISFGRRISVNIFMSLYFFDVSFFLFLLFKTTSCINSLNSLLSWIVLKLSSDNKFLFWTLKSFFSNKDG